MTTVEPTSNALGSTWGRRRVALVIAGTALTAAACGSSYSASRSSTPPPPAATGSAGGGAIGGGPYGGGGAAATTRAAAGAEVLGTRHTGLGTFLVDGSGRTLYLFEADRTSRSVCNAACAAAWPPLVVASGAMPSASSGVRSALISTSVRADGSRQVTYAGHPLYRYAGDSGPGTTNGQGSSAFGAKWYVVAPSGQKIDTD